MSKPGKRLGILASRVFHPDTMEYVIGPAIADLQLECTSRHSSRWRRSWVCLRAYLSFWTAVVAHLWSSLMDGSADATADDHRAVRRVLFYAAAIGVIVTAVLLVPVWLTTKRPQTAVDGDIVRALALLIPQATPISIPAGMLFGSLWAIRNPATRSVRRMVLVLGIACSLFSAGMLGWVIPQTNQAYRVVLYQDMLGRSRPPEKGANELTWPELRDRIRETNAVGGFAAVRQLRLSYELRIALTATPLIFAMFALVLVRRQRRSMAWLLGVLLFVGYYTLIRFDQPVDHGTLSPFAVAWTPNLVVLVLTLLVRSDRRVSFLCGQA